MLEKMLKEILKKVDGVYIEAEVDEKSSKKIKEYCDKNNIKTNDDYHCTIIYSKKEFQNLNNIKIPKGNIKGKVIDIIRFDNKDEDIYALAFKLKSKDLENLHNFYMKEYDFIYDFDEYIPHITLSYKAKNIDPNSLEVPNFEISFDKINVEALNLDWDKDKN